MLPNRVPEYLVSLKITADGFSLFSPSLSPSFHHQTITFIKLTINSSSTTPSDQGISSFTFRASRFQLRGFQGDEIPPFAIRAHVCSAGEVSYEELKDGLGKEEPGYAKINYCGEIAAEDGIDYF